jgi:peptide-methionine (S)-S-oxide reductase
MERNNRDHRFSMKPFALLALMMSAVLPLQAADAPKTETAIFGGGCFWCTEGVYQLVPGVTKVVSGYSGGSVDNPTYKQVCTGTTGHAEVVKIDFDPSKISYRQMVDLFWHAHDPTTLNYQGNDHGTQYRSVIFYLNDEQKKDAQASIADHQKEFKGGIVTELSPLTKFYPAEDYHQNFANDNPDQGYVCAIVKPKIAKFRKTLAAIEKENAEKK